MSPHRSLGDWIARDAIPFAVDAPPSVDAAVDRVVGSFGESVELLALGEALHGSEEILLVRNRMF
jgi:erythromycin esterase-like protein